MSTLDLLVELVIRPLAWVIGLGVNAALPDVLLGAGLMRASSGLLETMRRSVHRPRFAARIRPVPIASEPPQSIRASLHV